MKNFNYKWYTVVLIGGSLIGCSKQSFQSPSTATPSIVTVKIPTVSLNVKDQSNALVYSGKGGVSYIPLSSGTYSFSLSTTNVAATQKFNMSVTLTDVYSTPQTFSNLVAGTPVSVNLPSGSKYLVSVAAATPLAGFVTQQYNIALCSGDTFATTNINPGPVTFTNPTESDGGSSPTLFSFDVSGVVANAPANLGPYLCAVDTNGYGIVSTAPQDCTQPFTIYNNYVGPRDVAVIVMDKCYNYQTIHSSPNINLPKNKPVSYGNGKNFLYGEFANAGSTVTDKRLSGSYIANSAMPPSGFAMNTTNPTVTSSYNWQTAQFSVSSAATKYNIQSAVPHGLSMSFVVPWNYTFNAPMNPTGTYSAAVTVTTDQAGDSASQRTFNFSNCSVTLNGNKVTETVPSSCAAGGGSPINAENMPKVELWGTYQCVTPAAATDGQPGTLSITNGLFDAEAGVSDNCPPGGGGGDPQAPGF